MAHRSAYSRRATGNPSGSFFRGEAWLVLFMLTGGGVGTVMMQDSGTYDTVSGSSSSDGTVSGSNDDSEQQIGFLYARSAGGGSASGSSGANIGPANRNSWCKAVPGAHNGIDPVFDRVEAALDRKCPEGFVMFGE